MVLVKTQTDYAFFIHVCIVYLVFMRMVDEALSNFEYFVRKNENEKRTSNKRIRQ